MATQHPTREGDTPARGHERLVARFSGSTARVHLPPAVLVVYGNHNI